MKKNRTTNNCARAGNALKTAQAYITSAMLRNETLKERMAGYNADAPIGDFFDRTAEAENNRDDEIKNAIRILKEILGVDV